MMIRLSSLAWAGCVSTLVACGGAEPLGSGSLALSWQVSPRGCAEAGVRSVEIRLSGPEGLVERFDCQIGQAELEDLDAGSYSLRVVGLDDTGEPIFEAKPRNLTIDADRVESVGTLRLTAMPSQVDVTWKFSDGLVCGAHDVDKVVLAAFDTSDYEVARETFTCDDGAGVVRGLAAGAYIVEATAYASTRATHRGTLQIKTGRGESLAAEVELAPINP